MAIVEYLAYFKPILCMLLSYKQCSAQHTVSISPCILLSGAKCRTPCLSIFHFLSNLLDVSRTPPISSLKDIYFCMNPFFQFPSLLVLSMPTFHRTIPSLCIYLVSCFLTACSCYFLSYILIFNASSHSDSPCILTPPQLLNFGISSHNHVYFDPHVYLPLESIFCQNIHAYTQHLLYSVILCRLVQP